MEVTARTAYDDYMQPFDSYESQRRALDARMLDQLGKLDESWPDDPAVSELACELAVRHGISSHTASERLRIARALRQLPHIAMAHREGRLSWDQLRWVSRFATPETDEAWALRAPSMRPLALRQESVRQRRVTRLRNEQDEALRSFRMEWDEEHRLLECYGTFVGDKAAAFEAAVKKAAQEVPAEDDVDDRQGARQADALVGLVTSSGGRTRPATLIVHADAEVLARAREDATDEVVHRPANEATEEPGNEPSHKSTNEAPDGLTDECADRLSNDVSEGAVVEPATQAIDRRTVEPTDGKRLLAETSSGIQLSYDAVRRIACDAKVRIALERGGQPVGVVTTGRGVTESQLELLWFRDKHCTFPGCERTWFVQAHHIRHWSDGGKTTLENLTLLCSAHHRKLHKGKWTIRGRPGIDLRFHDPGRRREAVAA